MNKLLFSVTIKDCRVDTFRVGGHGGQHRDKTSSGVRVTHPPSGAVGESRESRSQHQNKKLAFTRMANSKQFQAWVRIQAGNIRPVEEIVDELMQPENLLFQTFEGGQWIKLP